MPSEPNESARLAQHLANERTWLAYVRTGISVISLGIALNRFGWFMVRQKLAEGGPTTEGMPIGLGMMVFGMGLLLWSARQHQAVGRAIDRGDYASRGGSVWVVTGLLVGLAGFALGALLWS